MDRSVTFGVQRRQEALVAYVETLKKRTGGRLEIQVADRSADGFRLGTAWIAMWLALAIHVTDEALSGFLSIYNPTVRALRTALGFWPMPTFEFREWLGGLSLGILVLAALTPFAFRNVAWIRPILFFCAVVTGVLNAMGHIAATIAGRTVSTVRFDRPAPGFWSSPVLLVAAFYALAQLRRTRSR